MKIKNLLSLGLALTCISILTPSNSVKAADAKVTKETKDTSNFVKTDGTRFTLGDSTFYFAGTNNYYLPYTPDYMVNDVFEKAQAMGLKVMRTWGFSDGEPHCDLVLQSSLGVYSEEGFKHFDYVVQQAEKYGMKLVVPLVNNWKEFGGINKYVEWTGAGSHDAFFTNENCKKAYKDFVNHFLNRTNSLTGVKYKDDPTIMTWELGNEPRCQSDRTGVTLVNWAKEMSDYIKSIDPDHLVAVGDEGFFNRQGNSDYLYGGGEGCDYDKLVALPSVDYGTYHLYPNGWGKTVEWGTQWIKDHIEATNAVNKPCVLEEYGVESGDSEKAKVYKTWGDTILENGGAGTMFWILTGVHWDKSKLYEDYDHLRVIYPSTVADVIADNAAKMTAKNTPIVVKPILGDLNDDKEVTVLDYILLQQYLKKINTNINITNADVNEDGSVNVKDLMQLRQMF